MSFHGVTHGTSQGSVHRANRDLASALPTAEDPLPVKCSAETPLPGRGPGGTASRTRGEGGASSLGPPV